MAEIVPFRALRYDETAVGDLETVVAPPYDVITPADQEELEARSPYNAVRLVLPRDDQGRAAPEQARASLNGWIAEGVLQQDPSENLTVYEQRYALDGEKRIQRGVLAAVRLDEPGGVLPHERTYDDIVADRLALLRATKTNLDCVFLVYDGRSEAAHRTVVDVCASEPLSGFTTSDGVEHAVWSTSQAAHVETIADALEKVTFVIADGHHRWRTAQHYRNERRAQDGPGPWDYQLAFLVDASRFGPALLPIHRVLDDVDASRALEALRPVFTIDEASDPDPEALARALTERRAERARTFVMLDRARAWWLTVSDEKAERDALPAERSQAWRDLDVAVLHHLVFDQLLGGARARYVHTASEAAQAVSARGIAFLLAPAPFEAVRAVAGAGEAMPQKSTYFVPKPKTGVVFRPLG